MPPVSFEPLNIRHWHREEGIVAIGFQGERAVGNAGNTGVELGDAIAVLNAGVDDLSWLGLPFEFGLFEDAEFGGRNGHGDALT